jgi:hypothetical protein
VSQSTGRDRPLTLCRLLVVFVPLTIYSLYMQRVRVFDPDAIENLAICSKIARTMIDLHDGADFYATILSSTLALANKHRALCHTDQLETNRVGDAVTAFAKLPDAETMLPCAKLHSLILRFHNLAVALGRMPKLDTIMPAGQKSA